MAVAKLIQPETEISCFRNQEKDFITKSLASCTVVTPNKGQSIFGKMGSNKGISQVPLFVIFDKWCEIRDFSVEISQK